MEKIKGIISALLITAAVTGMAGCGSGSPAGKSDSVNMREMIGELYATSTEMGLDGKYQSVSEITDGFIDKDIIGKWVSHDGEYSYAYADDGTTSVVYPAYDVNETTTFTCISAGDRKLICEDSVMTENSDGVETTTSVVTFSSYKVVGDTLYMMMVDELDEWTSSTYSTLITLYRADEAGNTAASVAGSVISPETFYGEWSNDEGVSLKIDENGMTVNGAPESIGGDPLAMTVNDKGNIVITAGGVSTEYSFTYSLNRTYTSDQPKTVEKEAYGLNLFYTGADENDRPNLADIMTDWHNEYGSEQFRFSVNLSCAK